MSEPMMPKLLATIRTKAERDLSFAERSIQRFSDPSHDQHGVEEETQDILNQAGADADAARMQLALLAEVERLRTAIVLHHRQKADDRCKEDDDYLYAAAGLPPADVRVGDKAAMLRSCERFIERRCEGGGWPSYAEVEAERDALRDAFFLFAERVGLLLGCLRNYRCAGQAVDLDGALRLVPEVAELLAAVRAQLPRPE